MVAFFAGTYLPPSDRQDQIGFQSLLSLIASQWKAQREALVASGQQFVEIVKMASQKTETPTNQVAVLLRKAVDDCFTHLNSIFDSEYGGFGGKPNINQTLHEKFIILCLRRSKIPHTSNS